MQVVSLAHLADHELVREFSGLLRKSNALTATLLMYLAEIDGRKLFVPAGYASMIRYCVGQFGMAEDTANKRILVARAARNFPAIYEAVAEGRLHLTGALLISPQLTPLNVERLIAAASGKSCAEIRELLAAEAPKPDVPTTITFANVESHALKHTNSYSVPVPGPAASGLEPSAGPAPAAPVADAHPPAAPRSFVSPLSPGRAELRMTITEEFAADLRAVTDLEGSVGAASDAARVLGRALKAYRAQLEKRRFAATSRPRESRDATNPRTIPSAVKREVWERDGGRCTFVSARGHRCECRRALQFDHIVPVARGGTSTVDNLRLLCRAHNQHAAEQIFGAGFMKEKRAKVRASQPTPAVVEAPPPDHSDLIPYLRGLKFTLDDARQAAAKCDLPLETRIEERVKWAIRYLTGPWFRRMTTPPPTSPAVQAS